MWNVKIKIYVAIALIRTLLVFLKHDFILNISVIENIEGFLLVTDCNIYLFHLQSTYDSKKKLTSALTTHSPPVKLLRHTQ